MFKIILFYTTALFYLYSNNNVFYLYDKIYLFFVNTSVVKHLSWFL